VTQRQIDFSRGEQLALLREAIIPDVRTRDGSRVKGATLKAVLRVLDDHGRGRECYLSHATIAREAGIGERHAKRATEALRLLSLVTTERKRTRWGASVNHYRIVWSELALLRATRTERSAPATRDQGAVVTDQGAVVTDQGAVVTPAQCRADTSTVPCTALKAPSEAQKETPSEAQKETPSEAQGTDGARSITRDEQSEALQFAQEFARYVPALRGRPDNQNLLVKVALLFIRGQLSQDAIEQALEAIRVNAPRNPAAYFHRCLDNAVNGDLNRLLSTCEGPARAPT